MKKTRQLGPQWNSLFDGATVRLSFRGSRLLGCSEQTEYLLFFGGIVSRVVACEDVCRSGSGVIDFWRLVSSSEASL